MKKYLFILFVFPVFSFSQNTGYRSIKEFGCHKSDGTCYVSIDGDPVNVPGCISNSVRWNSLTDPGGKNWVALIALAKSINKKVSFELNGCYSNQMSFPTFSYGAIEP